MKRKNEDIFLIESDTLKDKMNFDEFKKVSSKEWKQKIQYELNGEDYSNKFIWKSLEGVDVKPFYHHDDDKIKVSIDHRANSWKIGHSIYVNNEKYANSKALKLIKKELRV